MHFLKWFRILQMNFNHCNSGACYVNMKPKEGPNPLLLSFLQMQQMAGILQTLIPQLIKDIKLEKDGTITAYYSSDPIKVPRPLNGDECR